ncbi:pyridoxamine 5'-phosphate oxidase [Sphingomicrobium astaxanthinifaciens]|uniref:pyridoxamine 5'-phosphate oxidase n=1 Tax=Sphingomicrobium astaxanthinifaciens TaxID=1227949 RepID=UPI001FCA6C41|nr:pyridoxamine 5'-phosphate oxidase [Sphingomicrobium astaxanthinifaciens]MCJ7420828.1 pyridoxamine 5'-phosphate oxidase [Sphingomicrobium astaxanthinifaciens]
MAMDPFHLFDDWFAEARAAEPADPNAMALATATPGGAPSVRIVLLKDHGPDGFVFYTNQHSRKGEELAANTRAALAFHWKSTYKQVRIEGRVEPVDAATADAYFQSRGRDKQLAAAASDQSRPLPSRQVFLDRIAALEARYPEGDLPRPAHWGGYRLVPERIEFWEGTPERMHHRILFTRSAEGWDEGLLYP